MILTKDNFRVYASHYYDNPFCLSEDEFDSDLSKASVIKRLTSFYMIKGTTNVKLLVNTVIGFYNVFDHAAASEIIKFKLSEAQLEYANAVIVYLSYPPISCKVHEQFYKEIERTYND